MPACLASTDGACLSSRGITLRVLCPEGGQWHSDPFLRHVGSRELRGRITELSREHVQQQRGQ
eukprot:5055280-Alexandrium_andersonii.AAC.1